MNIFLNQAARKSVFTLLMVLLLSLSIALSCIGYSAWTGASIQQEQISSNYTTVAIPKELAFTPQSEEEMDEYALEIQKTVYADWAAQEAPQLIGIDRRCLLSAHVAGCKALSSSAMEMIEYNQAFDDECYSLSVFALRCESIKEDKAGEHLLYYADFQVEEVVSLASTYDTMPAPNALTISSYLRLEDGTTPFEVGKTYLVFGQYHDYSVVSSLNDEGVEQLGTRQLIPFPEISSNQSSDIAYTAEGTKDGKLYSYSLDNQFPWFAEYEGSATDFLSSQDGAVWKEEILPLCQINHESAGVILTDNTSSMYEFNRGDTTLLSGRMITQEEYESGAMVCLISASYAELNGLGLNDTLTLDYYDSDFGRFTNGGSANSSFATEDPGPYIQRYYMGPEDDIGVCQEYTIVGIYTGARFAFGTYHVNADTILVPKASVPNAEEYEEIANSLLNSFILENGSAEEFEAYMEEQGLGGQFIYLDQGYAAMAESLKALETNALRLLGIGIGIFLLAAVLFLFLNFCRMGPVIRGTRLLGVPAGTLCRQIAGVLLAMEALAAALGAVLGGALFHAVTQAVLSNSLTFSPQAIVVAAVVLYLLTGVASFVWAFLSARRRLMKSR